MTRANRAVYWVARAILQSFFHVYFRLRRIGLEQMPREGPVLMAATTAASPTRS